MYNKKKLEEKVKKALLEMQYLRTYPFPRQPSRNYRLREYDLTAYAKPNPPAMFLLLTMALRLCLRWEKQNTWGDGADGLGVR